MSASGEFVRDTRYLDGRITADGRDGSLPAEAGRYRLVVARGCPWANRTMIVRRLMGLEDALSMGICGPEHDERSWTFDLDPGGVDPVLGIHFLRDAYEKAVPGYDRGVTVPAIVEIGRRRGGHRRLPADHAGHGARVDGLPPARRARPVPGQAARRDRGGRGRDLRGRQQRRVQVRVRRLQAAYEEAYGRLFARLDQVCRAAGHPPLPDRGHDHRGRRQAVAPRWSGSTRSTTATSSATGTSSPRCRCSGRTPGTCTRRPGSATRSTSSRPRSTTTGCTRNLNPSGIVPAGPDLSGWLTPHHREDLGGRPFGDGTPPGPPPPAERVTNGPGR